MTSEISPVDLVGVGVNATDTIIELPHFPSLDTKMELTSARVLAGGQVATAVAACAAWGLKTRYMGRIGDDAAGQLQRREFARAGVDAHLECVQNARLLHVDGHDTHAAAAAARWAREAGIPVTADLDNIYPGLPELLAVTDYAITSQEFPARLTGERDLLKSLPMIRQRFGCRVVGVTLGKDGALVCDGAQFSYSPAYQVAAQDTTGAGDVFHAAFAYGILQGWPLPRLLDFSCAAAALNCTATGARGGIRPIAEIEALRQKCQRYPEAFPKQELERAGIAT